MEEKQKNKNVSGPDLEVTEQSDFWTPSRVRLLAGSIIIMSFLLLLGFGLVVYKLIEKAMVNTPPSAQHSASPVVTLSHKNSVKHFKIDLQGYKIRDLESNGRLITLHVVRDGKAQIWIVDSSEKKIKSIIEIEP